MKETIERTSQEGKDFDFEHRLLMPGFVKHVQVMGHALTDESGGIEFVGAVMDVTEQHQARAALERAYDEIKKSQHPLRLVFATIPLGGTFCPGRLDVRGPSGPGRGEH